MIITFFGHRDAPAALSSSLDRTLRELLEKNPCCCFYIGNQGRFDALVKHTLQQLSDDFPKIRIITVLAYMPPDRVMFDTDTLYPEGLENIPRRFAIHHRNTWMLKQADIVITHVISPAGGAAHFKDRALRMGKTVINVTT